MHEVLWNMQYVLFNVNNEFNIQEVIKIIAILPFPRVSLALAQGVYSFFLPFSGGCGSQIGSKYASQARLALFFILSFGP